MYSRQNSDEHLVRSGSRFRVMGEAIMVDWFVSTLRTYPEIAIFLSLALGYYFGSFTVQRPRPWCGDRHADCGRHHRAARDHHIATAQGHVLSDVPVCNRLWRRAAVRAGHRQGRSSAGTVCRGCLRLLPRCVPIIAAKIAGYDVGSALGLYAGFADHFRVDGIGNGRDQSSRSGTGRDQAVAGCDAGRLRGHVYFRHDRIWPSCWL